MFVICLKNIRLSLSIFAFAHRHTAHLSILTIALFQYVLHILISSKCQSGTNWVSYFIYSNGFFVISHILSNMLEINVYRITNSMVFSVTIRVNSSCHYRIEVK